MKTFSRTRAAIGAFAVGAARSAMEYALEYAKSAGPLVHPYPISIHSV
ncbi:MAG: hypothetical protein R2860_08300 [Desulfobacterales bacterium]